MCSWDRGRLRPVGRSHTDIRASRNGFQDPPDPVCQDDKICSLFRLFSVCSHPEVAGILSPTDALEGRFDFLVWGGGNREQE